MTQKAEVQSRPANGKPTRESVENRLRAVFGEPPLTKREPWPLNMLDDAAELAIKSLEPRDRDPEGTWRDRVPVGMRREAAKEAIKTLVRSKVASIVVTVSGDGLTAQLVMPQARPTLSEYLEPIPEVPDLKYTA